MRSGDPVNPHQPATDALFDRFNELMDTGTLSCWFEPEDIVVQMGFQFALKFITESKIAGDKIVQTKRGWSRYCMSGPRKGMIDFRFTVNPRLPTTGFLIRL